MFEAGQVQYAPMYMDKNYIQHNPNVANGRDAFIAFLTAFVKPTPVQPRVQLPLVAITADGDLVTLVSVRTLPNPNKPGTTYTTTVRHVPHRKRPDQGALGSGHHCRPRQ